MNWFLSKLGTVWTGKRYRVDVEDWKIRLKPYGVVLWWSQRA